MASENANKKRPPENQRIDDHIKKTLAQLGRNSEALRKITDGTYVSLKRNTIFMVKDFDAGTEMTVEYVRSDNTVFKTTLKRFISEFE